MRQRLKLRPEEWTGIALAICCVFLIAFTAFLTAVHTHSSNSGVPSHSCSICALTHCGVAPAALSTMVPGTPGTAFLVLRFQAHRILLSFSDHFIRPPPLG
jgi:hypothetical protein